MITVVEVIKQQRNAYADAAAEAVARAEANSAALLAAYNVLRDVLEVSGLSPEAMADMTRNLPDYDAWAASSSFHGLKT